MSKNTVLIDGDYIAYVVASSKEGYPLEEATEYLDEWMTHILNNCKEAFGDESLQYATFLSGKNNKRKEKYPDYKENRKDKQKPEHLTACRMYLSAMWGGIQVDGIEADDAVGICAHYLPTERTIIATADKDFAQMRNIWVYDIYPARAEKPRKEGQPYIARELTENGVWYRTDDKSALKQLAYQLIYGDSGDGIKGLTQYNGKKRAHKKTALEVVWAVGEETGWEDRETVLDEIKLIYMSEFGQEEGTKEFEKTFHLVYIQEYFCEEFKEIPKMKEYDN